MIVDWGDLRRVKPISPDFGFDRGTPIDRYYIEGFLASCSSDIRGRVLEVGDDSYTRRFGRGRVDTCDVLHVDDSNPDATIVGDLQSPEILSCNRFDCAIVTQTLHLIFDISAALQTLLTALVPGGILLLTVPGVSPLSRDQWNKTWYWSLTRYSLQGLAAQIFGDGNYTIEAYGNVFAITCFLEGISAEEVPVTSLDAGPDGHDLLLALRAQKVKRR